jgi:Protein of unknown function (DUF1375)
VGLCSGGLAAGVGLSPPDQKFDRSTCVELGCCALVDLPFSLVADTLTLPITLVAESKEGAEESTREGQLPERR